LANVFVLLLLQRDLQTLVNIPWLRGRKGAVEIKNGKSCLRMDTYFVKGKNKQKKKKERKKRKQRQRNKESQHGICYGLFFLNSC